MTNVVVTGGYGFIGSHLVSTLLDRGDSVTVFDLAKNGRDSAIDFDRHANFRFVQGDVADMAAIGGRYEDIPVVDHRFPPGRSRRSRNISRSASVSMSTGSGTRTSRSGPSAGTHVVFASTSEVLGKTRTRRSAGTRSRPRFDEDRALDATAPARPWPNLVFGDDTAHLLRRYFSAARPTPIVVVISQNIHRILNGRLAVALRSVREAVCWCFTYVGYRRHRWRLAPSGGLAVFARGNFTDGEHEAGLLDALRCAADSRLCGRYPQAECRNT